MEHIPSYAYVSFCVLVYIGVKRCYPRVARPERMIALPVLFVLLGALSLNQLFPRAGLQDAVAGLLAGGAGLLLGWMYASRWYLQLDTTKTPMRVRMPGDPSLLVTLLLTFAARSFIHYSVESHAPWAATDMFTLFSFATWGVLAGLPLGRASNVLVRCARMAGDDGGAAPTLGRS